LLKAITEGVSFTEGVFMEITQEKLARLSKGLKKICDSCDEQAIKLSEIRDGLDEITAEVQILWAELEDVT